MSVLIKGMEMPKSCFNCRFYFGDMDYCEVTGKNYTSDKEIKMPDCPLVEIPTPHGDLIDREKVKELLLDLWKTGKNYTIADTIREIVDIPTIIEAEE